MKHHFSIGCPWCSRAISITLTTEEPAAVAETLIEELPLHGRTYNALKEHRIDTVGQLITKTPAQLLRLKNMGRKSLNEIREVLAQRGLALHPIQPVPADGVQ